MHKKVISMLCGSGMAVAVSEGRQGGREGGREGRTDGRGESRRDSTKWLN